MYVSAPSATKENVLKAVRFEKPEYIPMTFHINDACWHSYEREFLFEQMALHPFLFPGFEYPKGDFVVDYAPNEVLLVLDGSTGQNAFEQARQFTLATEVTALAITKLDGTAKGGVVIGVSDQFKIPVRYVGLGEGIDDLQPFNKSEFVDSLF